VPLRVFLRVQLLEYSHYLRRFLEGFFSSALKGKINNLDRLTEIKNILSSLKDRTFTKNNEFFKWTSTD